MERITTDISTFENLRKGGYASDTINTIKGETE